MKHLLKFGREFLSDESGSTAIEYGLIAALIAIGIIASLYTFSSSNNSIWNQVSDKVENVF
jgi:pilus assembly protein Flp/PilA